LVVGENSTLLLYLRGKVKGGEFFIRGRLGTTEEKNNSWRRSADRGYGREHRRKPLKISSRVADQPMERNIGKS